MGAELTGSRRTALWAVVDTLVVVYTGLPVLWILSLSVKPTSTVKDDKLIPSSVTLDNYRGIFRGDFFSSALINSIGIGLITTVIAVVLGAMAAYAIARLDFPGKRLVDALVDLPFALPTAVAGIALSALYAPNGWIGRPLDELFGLKVAFTPLGIAIALTFIGLPFVVRTVQPILQDLPPEEEEAAASLGASRLRTFGSIILPAILPALVTGFALSFARGIGEYGSVIFIAGNMPGLTEILPLLIVIKLEQYDYAGAAAVGTAMLGVSFVMLLILNLLQQWMRSRHVR